MGLLRAHAARNDASRRERNARRGALEAGRLTGTGTGRNDRDSITDSRGIRPSRTTWSAPRYRVADPLATASGFDGRERASFTGGFLRRGGDGPAHCLRQCRQPAAVTRPRAPPGDGSARRTWGEPLEDRTAVALRKRGFGASWRHCRDAVRILG